MMSWTFAGLEILPISFLVQWMELASYGVLRAGNFLRSRPSTAIRKWCKESPLILLPSTSSRCLQILQCAGIKIEN